MIVYEKIGLINFTLCISTLYYQTTPLSFPTSVPSELWIKCLKACFVQSPALSPSSLSGSLFDLIHNATLQLEGDVVGPMLVDVARGMRFLHAADPPLIHGDLKSRNILVDANLRAKAISIFS